MNELSLIACTTSRFSDGSFWAQWGLPGAVIGALFFTLALGIVYAFKFFNSREKIHSEERLTWKNDTATLHREFLEDANNRQNKSDAVVEKLTDAITDLREENIRQYTSKKGE